MPMASDFMGYSDLFKDIYGFRPRGDEEVTQEEYDYMLKRVEEVIKEEKQYARDLAASFIRDYRRAARTLNVSVNQIALWEIEAEDEYVSSIEDLVFNRTQGMLDAEVKGKLVKFLSA